ncbi:MAG: toll/interleukin-1 receptor domain-containing protein [Lachnospiraceae bacterium]|nr:toll/interleukin-1 receptor domain-containing protein [Lachnospiraceae bacterium]
MRYDAFISYRHSELDMFVAKKVHKGLETFKVPRAVQKKSGKKTIKRVFRDQEELPIGSDLNNNISSALENSEYLLVICSPRTKDSYWVEKEISSFIEMHGRNNILAILIEGEPDESFPTLLLTDENGNPVEPLAADVRGKDKKEVNKKLKTEIVRLAAPLLNCSYDDLKQRHKERRMKKAIAFVSVVGAIIAALGISFGLYNANMARQIQENFTEKQISQAKYLSEVSDGLLSIGDRRAATLVALSALPESGSDRPYVTEAEAALVHSVYAYEDDTYLNHDVVYPHDLPVLDMRANVDGTLLTSYDSKYTTYVWDTDTNKQILKIDNILNRNGYYDYIIYANVIDNKLVIVTKEHLYVYSLENELLYLMDLDYANYAEAYLPDSVLAIVAIDRLSFFDVSKLNVISSFDKEDNSFTGGCYFSSNGNYFVTGTIASESKDSGSYCLCDLKKNTIEYIVTSKDSIAEVAVYDNKDSVALTYSSADTFNVSLDDFEYILDYNCDKDADKNWSYPVVLSFMERQDTSTILKVAQKDNTTFLVLSAGNSLYSFNNETGMPIYKTSVGNKISSYWITGNGTAIIAATIGGDINIINSSTGENYDNNTIDSNISIRDAIICNGHVALRSRYDSNLTIMSYPTAAFQLSEKDNEKRYEKIYVSPDGNTLAYINKSNGFTVDFYSAETEELISEFDFPDKNYYYYDFRDNNVFVAIDQFGIFTTFSISDGTCNTFDYEDKFVAANTAISKNLERAVFYTNGDFGKIHVIDLVSGEYSEYDNPTGYISALETASHSDKAWGLTDDGFFELNTSTGEFDFDFPDSLIVPMQNNTFALSKDDKYISALCIDNYIRILNTETREIVTEIPFDLGLCMFMYFTDDNSKLFLQGGDYLFRVYDINDNKFIYAGTEIIASPDKITEYEDIIVYKTYGDLYILNSSDFTCKAYISNGQALSIEQRKIFAASSFSLKTFHYATLEELIEEAHKQFPDDALSDYEKAKYHVE